MRRRNFLKVLSGASLATLFRIPGRAMAQGQIQDPAEIDPYFLGSGKLDQNEREQIESYMEYLAQRSVGEKAFVPRGGRPERAPTYRVLYWTGEIGDPNGHFVGPLSIQPMLPRGSTYRMNAQILNLHTHGGDWGGDHDEGTLSVEMRARIRGESLTWLYAQQFQLYGGGSSDIGLEYVAQREGVPVPVSTDEGSVDIRIQLIRHRKKRGSILRNIFRLTARLLPFGNSDIVQSQVERAATSIRVPQMLNEGTAFSQSLFGVTAEEAPLWRSGFTSFGIAEGRSRIALREGIWVVIDETREPDLTGVSLIDAGGRVKLLRDGDELGANYLVLGIECEEGPLPELYGGGGYDGTEPDPNYYDGTEFRERQEKGQDESDN